MIVLFVTINLFRINHQKSDMTEKKHVYHLMMAWVMICIQMKWGVVVVVSVW